MSDHDSPHAGEEAWRLQQEGHTALALERWRAVLAGDPDDRPALRGASECLAALDAVGEALALAQRLVGLRSDDAGSRLLLAGLLLRTGEASPALEHAREARFLAPHSLAAATAFAAASLAAGDPLPGVEALAALLAHAHPADPDLPPAQSQLGRGWAALGEPARAAAAWRAALAGVPADSEAALDLVAEIAALETPADGLAPAYVRALFDRYAERFDADLGRLRYQAPEALGQAVAAAAAPAPGSLDVLDLGCGTGLSGVPFRPVARHLAGVDLAPRMVARAAARGIYDELAAGDALGFLAATPARWDLLVAADMLMYLGELAPLLAAAHRALRSGGWFAGTVERSDGPGFSLQPSRRFAHSRSYLQEAIKAAGFAAVSWREFVPRWEAGRPVPGLLFVLRR